jgi:hypothetical protein
MRRGELLEVPERLLLDLPGQDAEEYALFLGVWQFGPSRVGEGLVGGVPLLKHALHVA